MPQVSDFIGENTDIWNFNNLNIDFHPILPTYPKFNDESAKVQVLCKNHFLSKKILFTYCALHLEYCFNMSRGVVKLHLKSNPSG